MASTSTGGFSNIAGETASTYIHVADDAYKFIRVLVMASGNYTGIALSSVIEITSQ